MDKYPRFSLILFFFNFKPTCVYDYNFCQAYLLFKSRSGKISGRSEKTAETGVNRMDQIHVYFNCACKRRIQLTFGYRNRGGKPSDYAKPCIAFDHGDPLIPFLGDNGVAASWLQIKLTWTLGTY